MIPQSNPKANYIAHKKEIDSAINRVLESGWYIIGQEVRTFEKEFAQYIGTEFGIGVANGTDAIELALRALNIGFGDIVVTVSHTAVATVAAIIRTGATPVFIDIDPDCYTMDPNQLFYLLSNWSGPLPKAVIPVHLYGQPADMHTILRLAKHYGLFVIEDCAQAHGAEINGVKVGSFGDIGCFSLYPTKNLGAIGDGGIVVTDNKELAEKLLSLREYGWIERYISQTYGTNSRLDELQAAILRIKLAHLDIANSRRKNIAEIYTSRFHDLNLLVPKEAQGIKHVYHQYVIRTNFRDLIQKKLRDNGVQTLIHYPIPVHMQPAFCNKMFSPLSLLNTEKITQEILSLPMFPELTEENVNIVCEVMRRIIY